MTIGIPVIDLRTQQLMTIVALHSIEQTVVCEWVNNDGQTVADAFTPDALEFPSRRQLRLVES